MDQVHEDPHLDERPYHCGESSARIDAEYRHRHGNGKLEFVGGRRKGGGPSSRDIFRAV